MIPFISTYRPLWLGLGALAFDLMLALAITSLLRRRLGYRAWRAIHWLAYVCWPIAVLHGLGTGTDTKIWWMLLLTALCVAAVVVAVLCPDRPGAGPARGLARPGDRPVRGRPGGAGRVHGAGTAAEGLGAAGGDAGQSAGPRARAGRRRHGRCRAGPRRRHHRRHRSAFSATLAGSVRQAQIQAGAIVDLSMRLSGGARGRLRVRLGGAPIAGGGLSLTGSQVDLSPPDYRRCMQGQISQLEGERFVARVLGSAGTAMTLHVDLHIDVNSNAVTGQMTALPGR